MLADSNIEDGGKSKIFNIFFILRKVKNVFQTKKTCATYAEVTVNNQRSQIRFAIFRTGTGQCLLEFSGNEASNN